MFLAFSCLVLITVVVGNPYVVEVEQHTTGKQNGGSWDCPWTTTGGFECGDGKFFCNCPGDGKQIKYKVGCCYDFPKCGKICNKNYDCSRYNNCHSCRSEVEGSNYNACTSCKNGFALGSGNCLTDVNECSNGNGGCGHRCTNSYGSYHCSCNDGYRLNGDFHSCDVLSCPPLDAQPGTQIEVTGNNVYESFTKIECLNKNHTLVGPSLRQCVANGEKMSWSNDNAINCIDKCYTTSTEERTQCGTAGIDEQKCLQLGCCFDDADDTAAQCYRMPGAVYIEYAGEKPTDSSVVLMTHQDEEVASCGYRCDTSKQAVCPAFGIRRRELDEAHQVWRMECQPLAVDRQTLKRLEKLAPDDAYSIFDGLSIDDYAAKFGGMGNDIEASLTKQHLGCYDAASEDGEDPDFKYRVDENADDMSPSKCIKACRHQGFSVAALQNRKSCWCSSRQTRPYLQSEGCDLKCPGDASRTCGGSDANDIYSVPATDDYLGCYGDSEAARDLPVNLWMASAGKSASQCAKECASYGYAYAGLQGGGACYCGATYGRHGAVDEVQCSKTCQGWSKHSCGGDAANAIYKTNKWYDVSAGEMPMSATKIYDSQGQITGVSTMIFSQAPDVRVMHSKKFIIKTFEPVLTPIDDMECFDNCYKECGEITQAAQENVHKLGEDVILRFFHINLSDLSKYVGEEVKSVYVYAQTVVVDATLMFDFSLYIRTRQLIVDRSKSQFIGVSAGSKDLREDLIGKDKEYDADLLFEKQSLVCARILYDVVSEQTKLRSFAITNLIIQTGEIQPQDFHSLSQNELEVFTFSSKIRMNFLQTIGILRENVRFVPYYTKSHISEILETYYEEISLYKNKFDLIASTSNTAQAIIDYTEEMQKIYTDTDIVESRTAYESAMSAVTRSNATTEQFLESYRVSRFFLDDARDVFEKGLKSARQRAIIKFAIDFAAGSTKVVYGITNLTKEEVTGNVGTLNQTLKDSLGLFNTMKDLANTINQVNQLGDVADGLITGLENLEMSYDYLRYTDDLERTVQLQANIILWKNYKNHVEYIMDNGDIKAITGALDYERSIYDVINWGQALTEVAVEHAELLRKASEERLILDGKLQQQEKIQSRIDAAKSDIDNVEYLLADIIEQSYDVRLDLNRALLTFCQAYFFENLYECREAYTPEFGGDFNTLLLKINAAKKDDLLSPGISSSVSRIVTITDIDTSADCIDPTLCPIKYLKENREFYFHINYDNQQLSDLYNYKVAEIVFEFVGAKSTNTNKNLKVSIESTGEFQSLGKSETHQFLSRALDLAFEYNIETGALSIHADVYEPYRSIMHQVTPYTTWVIRVSPIRSADIDLSGVTQVRMRLDGSALDSETLRARIHE